MSDPRTPAPVKVCTGCGQLFTTGRLPIRTPAGEFCTEDCLDSTWARQLRHPPTQPAPPPTWGTLVAIALAVLAVWAVLVWLGAWWWLT